MLSQGMLSQDMWPSRQQHLPGLSSGRCCCGVSGLFLPNIVDDCVPARVQILLTQEELALFDDVQRPTGASRSESIRRAISGTFGEVPATDQVRQVQQSAGTWKGRNQDGGQYSDSLSGNRNDRLDRLGFR